MWNTGRKGEILMNIIGDIGGFAYTAQRLIKKMPAQNTTVLLGDLNDRGPHSKQMISFAMDNEYSETGNIITLDSNHGDMFGDYVSKLLLPDYTSRYDNGIFLYNGGHTTLNSYMMNDEREISQSFFDFVKTNPETFKSSPKIKLMEKHARWLLDLPSHVDAEVRGQRYFLTHAPMNVNPHIELETFLNPNFEKSYLWNRSEPDRFRKELPNTISVFGHNSSDFPKIFCKSFENGIKVRSTEKLREIFEKEKGQIWGIGMDTTRGEWMYGLDLYNLEFYTERWVD